jgi:hypothetical protein
MSNDDILQVSRRKMPDILEWAKSQANF